jgi:hypothetical protein
MTLTEVGLFAQLKGSLTKKRYKCCTIFVDNYSCLRFVHLQIDDSAELTMGANLAFEKYAAKHGISIKHYHCDNEQFAYNAFKQSCKSNRQRLPFCGVNVHFKNGIAEPMICNLSNSLHKQLLHACSQWPAAVHFCSVAICPQKHNSPPQQPASAGGWHIKAGAIQLNSSGRQHEAHAHFWVPSVCTSKCTCIRQHSP